VYPKPAAPPVVAELKHTALGAFSNSKEVKTQAAGMEKANEES